MSPQSDSEKCGIDPHVVQMLGAIAPTFPLLTTITASHEILASHITNSIGHAR